MRQQRSPRAKELDHAEVVSYLSRSFARAVYKANAAGNLSKALRTVKNGKVSTTDLYDLQVDFSYMIDEIERGPVYIAPKIVSDVKELIAKIEVLATKA